jgi:hypothetical protein
LPAGVNGLMNLYCDGYLVMTKQLTQSREIFRLPSGFKVFNWQIEIVSCVEIFDIEMAETMRELKLI